MGFVGESNDLCMHEERTNQNRKEIARMERGRTDDDEMEEAAGSMSGRKSNQLGSAIQWRRRV